MKRGLGVIVAVGIVVFACRTKDHSRSNDKISGTYVREYSFKVVNPETGNEIGLRTIRDTIFVNPKQNGYEVSNNKWRLNDYSKEGWQNMGHTEDQPMPTYIAAYDPSDSSLNAEHALPLYLELIGGNLYKGEKGDAPFRRVQ